MTLHTLDQEVASRLAAKYAAEELGRKARVAGALVRGDEALVLLRCEDGEGDFALHVLRTWNGPVAVVDELEAEDYFRNGGLEAPRCTCYVGNAGARSWEVPPVHAFYCPARKWQA